MTEEFPKHIQSVQDRFAHTCEKDCQWFISVAVKNLHFRVQREAQDVVQDAFVSALAQLDNYRGEGTMRSWIAAMVVRIAWQRSRRKEPTLLAYNDLGDTWVGLMLESADSSAEDMVICDQILDKVLPKLSDEQQEYLGAWSRGDLKGELTTMKARNKLHRATKRMRRIANRSGVLTPAKPRILAGIAKTR